MNKETIEAGNKVIAEFIGAKKRYFLKYKDGKPWKHYGEKISDTPFEDVPYKDYIHQSGKNMTTYPVLQHHAWQMTPDSEIATFDSWLKYHSSFDWLMPVVDKISSVVIKGIPPYNSDQFVRVEIVPNGYVKISDLRDTPITSNVSVEGSLIMAIWVAVVEFIKWHNTNKSSQ